MTSRSRGSERVTWIPVEEELPDSETTVLIFGAEGLDPPVWLGWYDSLAKVWREVSADEVANITHWAEIPEGPKP